MVTLFTTQPIEIKAGMKPDTDEVGNIVTVIGDEIVDPPPPPPIDDPPDFGIGCDPRVKEGTFTLEDYDVPTPKGPFVTLETFGGAFGKDSTDALRQAMASLPEHGGTIRLGNGLYGLNGNSRFSDRRDISIIGEGRGSGFFAVQQAFIGEWRALLEIERPTGLFIDNVEFDMRDQKIGCIRYWEATDTWFTRLYCHDLGGSADGARQIPLAAIKGSAWSKNHHEVGNYLARGWGNASSVSGVRGTWGPQDEDGFDGALWEHIWAEDFGHTNLVPSAGTGDPHIVRRCTSIGSRGAAIKTETPDGLKARDGEQQSEVFYPDHQVIQISRCILRFSAFHGVQAECVGTSVKDCYIEGNSNGVATYNRCLRLEVVNNIMVNDKDSGVWCSLDAGQEFGSIDIRNNTIRGNKRREGIGFDPKCQRPIDKIDLIENKTDPGVKPITVTPEIDRHPGYTETNNGPDAAGAKLRDVT